MSSNATNYRFRPLNPFYYNNWQAGTAEARAADEIIACPEKHLLTQSELFEAEGGAAGLAMQTAVVLLGIGAVFASSSRMGSYFAKGSLNRWEWLCLGGTAVSANWIGTQAGIAAFGDRFKYNNHWTAYGFIKSQNRWQGRTILKTPFMY